MFLTVKKAFPLLAFLAFCVALSLPFFLSPSFEDTFLEIRSASSMKDDTKLLTKEEQVALKDLMNTLYQEVHIRMNFHIAEEKFKPQYRGASSLFTGIDLKTNEITILYPQNMKEIFGETYLFVEKEIEDNLNTCLAHVPSTSIGACLINNYNFILKVFKNPPQYVIQ